MMIKGIDETDNKIIELLADNARMSYSEIGERLSLSRTAVKNRIDALEKSGVIKGYTVVVDPHKASGTMTYITTIETEPAAYDNVAEALKAEECVVTLCQVSGECTLHAVCVVESVDEMREFAKRMRNENQGLIRFYASGVWEVMKGSVPVK
jgi:DNA-binding Lrp family transcriptional regulator